MVPKSPPTEHFLERMKKDKCFTCGIEGHWSRCCPYKTHSSESSSFHVTKDYEEPVVYCCCDLPCVVKEINGVKRFCCSRWKHYGCGHMELFDKVEAPQCTCGAGAASVHKWMKMDPNMGRIYYACRIKKGHGACSFFEWKDTKANSPVNGCVGISNTYIPPQSALSDIQITDTLDSSKGRKVDFSPPQPKRLKFGCLDTDDMNHLKGVSQAQIERRKITDTLDSSKGRKVDFSPPQPKRLKFGCLDTDDMHHLKGISQAQIEWRKHSFEDSAGTLLMKESDFMVTSEDIPSRAKSGADHKNLMFSTSNSDARNSAIEGVVPNFDATRNTQSKSILSISKSSASFRNLVAGSCSLSQGQALDNSPIEPSVHRATTSKAQENWQAVACLQETFHTVLESMNPFDIESTNRKVEKIVGALACLGVDTKPLWEQVSIVSEDLKRAETSRQRPVWKKLLNIFRSKWARTSNL